MVSQRLSVVIFLVVCSLVASCGSPPASRETLSDQSYEASEEQLDQPPSVSEQSTTVPAKTNVPTQTPTDVPQPKTSLTNDPESQEESEALAVAADSTQEQPQTPPNLAVAAGALGITEQELMEALGPPPPDLSVAAQNLGISEEELRNALFPTGELDLGAEESNQPQTIDITNATLTQQSGNCADYVNSYTAEALDVAGNIVYKGSLMIEIRDGTCVFTSNAIPNHQFNDTGDFASDVQEQQQSFTTTTNPQKKDSPTALSLRYDNAILLNGVKVDLLAAGCYGVGNGINGCIDMTTPWRYDPMFAGNNFAHDSHNAHTQPDGTYHYHGNPKALFNDSDGSVASPVIGFAADGFPIFGSYFNDNGTIRKAISSYQLRGGSRPSDNGNPGGTYDGTFIDDYEYIEGAGDLDECNGMTVNGVYGYYITDSYPYILGCFSGTPDASFEKSRP